MLRAFCAFLLALAGPNALAELGAAIADVRSPETPRLASVAEGEAFPIEIGGERVRRYRLMVDQSEDPEDGLELTLPVIVVKAAEPSGLAPVLMLSGGPGVGDLSAAYYPGAYPWTRHRDFIILGRRGTRFAEPSLQCPEIGSALVETGAAGEAALSAALSAALDACRRALSDQGVRLDAYHSAASASDIEALRGLLGAEQLALYGLSYGTRLALTYARDYPERVEAMVLDSPLPHTARYDDELAVSSELVLRRIARACAAQPACDEAFPDLEARYFAAVAGALEQGLISRADLVAAIGATLGGDLGRAPLLMDATVRGDRAAFASAAVSAPSDFDWGVRLSVWCSEALPFARRAEGEVEGSFGALDGAVFKPETCAEWGVPARPASEIQPTVSDAPTLILAGELDVLTPPRWGYQAAETLSRSRVLPLTAGRHTETTNWSGDGCAMSLAAAFFDDPEGFLGRQEEPACLQARAFPQFATELGAEAPQ